MIINNSFVKKKEFWIFRIFFIIILLKSIDSAKLIFEIFSTVNVQPTVVKLSLFVFWIQKSLATGVL